MTPKLRPPRSRFLARSLALSAILAAPSAADVLVVDAAGGTPYRDVQAAVDAAAEGDTILIRGGSYAGVLIDAKAVDLVAEAGESVVLGGGIRVTGLPAGGRVLLQGLRVEGVASGADLSAGHGLLLSADAGAVRVEDCTLAAASNLVGPPGCAGIGDSSGWEAAVVTDCPDVVLTGCTLQAGDGVIQRSDVLMGGDGCGFFTPGGGGGHGASLSSSNVALYDCQVSGGAGGYGGFGGEGGAAVLAFGGTLFLSGSTLQGGPGGEGFDFLAGEGGDGGHGVSAPVPFELGTVGSVLAGGPGGPSFAFDPGDDGAPISGAVAVTPFGGAARSLSSPSPVRVGETFALSLSGEPFDAVLLGASGQDFHLALPLLAGILLEVPVVSLSVGALDARGELSLPLALNPIGGPSAVFLFQAVHVSTGLEVRLGSVRHLVVLDAGI